MQLTPHMHKILALKKVIISLFIILAAVSVAVLPNLKFSFDFSQFFPEGDEDLVFYKEFKSEFGTDDNFLLIALPNNGSVFERDFLTRFHKVSKEAKKLSFVKVSQSLTTLSYPLKTSFGYTKLPIIHLNEPDKYEADWAKIKEDGLFINTLIDENASSLVLALETKDELDYDQSITLLTEVRQLLDDNNFNEFHLLGRAYFYEAIVAMQKSEVIKTSLASFLLVFLILYLIYRRFIIVFICLLSITLSLLLFFGLLSVLGIQLSAMAAFYPILMLIVGTSDVIHIMDDYLAKLRLGLEKETALIQSLREVGVSTLLTSITTAIGFASLLTSKSSSISSFGVNSAIGVLTAFITVLFFTCSLLLLFKNESLLRDKPDRHLWNPILSKVNKITKSNGRIILVGSLVFTAICLVGIGRIDTNYEIKESLPKNSAIANDFVFFQENYSGFRPLEVAVLAQNQNKVTDFDVVHESEKVEQYLKRQSAIRNVQSVNTLYKALHKAHNLNKSDYFVLPTDENVFNTYQKDIDKLARKQKNKFVNAKENKARISARVLDVGTDSLNVVYDNFKSFTKNKIDSTLVKYKLTGSGVLLDKNSYYVRDSLIQGLIMGLLLVAIIMALIFRNLKILLISMLPNLLPLLFAAALLGYFGIALEATISVVFAIVFGIAVDDTIHFLGRYRIGTAKGLSKEEALEVTFQETGRALIITTATLFFGFMILLFSEHSPSVTIGLLVSVTLLAALILDLLLLPVLIRRLL